MMKNKKNNIIKNTTMLMIFQLAKIIFPFITLPYLTRVLSLDTYGVVTYVKTMMTYMQIFVDFGFVLSATKDVVKARENKDELGIVIGDTMIARTILGLIGYVIVIVLSFLIPILKENFLYTILSYTVVFVSVFLMDFLFRGIEKMHVITIRFILMKTISTVFTFLLIKNDSNVMLIPILDLLSSLVAILLVWNEVRKLGIKLKVTNLKNEFSSLKNSFVYFLSNVASTSFNALSTLIIGIYINKSDIALWGVCMQIIGTITACYNPIIDGIYPEMIKSRDLNIIRNVIKIFMPIIILGCIFCYVVAPFIFRILGGENYLQAVPIFRALIPTLIFSFGSILFGWSTLGAIEKEKEVTLSTIVALIFYIVFMLILIKFEKFTLINIAIARDLTEVILFAIRFSFFIRYRNLFNKDESK